MNKTNDKSKAADQEAAAPAPEFVARDPWSMDIQTMIRFQTQLAVVNRELLPLLDSIGFPRPNNYEELLQLKGRDILARIVPEQMKGRVFEHDYERLQAEFTLAQSLTDRLNSIAWPRPYPAEYHRSVSYEADAGQFVFDSSKICEVYAETDKERAALLRLQHIVELVNSLQGTADLSVRNILGWDDKGRFRIMPEIQKGAWKKFVESQPDSL